MPNIGDIISGRKRGLKGGELFIWEACIDCGKERWVPKKCYESGTHQRCINCNAKLSNEGNFDRRNYERNRYSL